MKIKHGKTNEMFFSMCDISSETFRNRVFSFRTKKNIEEALFDCFFVVIRVVEFVL